METIDEYKAEIERLLKKLQKLDKFYSIVLYAYVTSAEEGKIIPLDLSGEPLGYQDAMKYIFALNRWRSEKRFGDLEP